MEERTHSSASLRRKRSSSKKLLRYSAQALSQFILMSTTIFLSLALVGVSVQMYSFVSNGNPSFSFTSWFSSKKTGSGPQEDSLASLAFSATATAVSLWGKVIMSVLIPATDHSLVFAREGWGALEPSLKQSVTWFIFESTAVFKLGVVAFFVFVFVLWLLEKEIKRRRIVERISARVQGVNIRVKSVGDSFRSKYVLVKAEVERESRIAATLLPHLIYVIVCIATYLMLGNLVAPISRGFPAWSIVVGIPVVFSTQKLLKYDEICRARLKTLNPDDVNLSSSSGGEEEEESDDEGKPPSQKSQLVENALLSLRKRFLSDTDLSSPNGDTRGELNSDTVQDFDPLLDWLRYWTVLSVCLLWEQFPVTGHFLSIIPVWPEMRLAFALWLQLPVTRGCDWAFLVVVPFLDRYVKKLPLIKNQATGLLQQTEQQRGIVVTLLSSMGLVSKKTGKKLLKATETNGTLILMSIPFMLSPSFVTKIGVLVVGLAFPSQSSTTSILEIEHFKQAEAVRKKGDGDDGAAELSGEASVFWLEYWIVYVLFSLVHGSMAAVFGWWFPLWDQIHLGILLWMQITYFSGAHHVFNIAVVIARVFRRRRRSRARVAVAQRRRRENSVATPQEKIEDLISSVMPGKPKPKTIEEEAEEEFEEERSEKDRRASSVIGQGRRASSVTQSERRASSVLPERASSIVARPDTPPPSVSEEFGGRPSVTEPINIEVEETEKPLTTPPPSVSEEYGGRPSEAVSGEEFAVGEE